MSFVLDNKPEPKWITYIKNRIKKNKNFLGFIGGPTGSGKSWCSLAIAEMLDPEFNIDRVVFRGSQLMELINGGELKSGSVIVYEEAGVTMNNRNWQSTTNKALNFLMQTFRHRNFILIFNSPYMDFVDGASRKLFHAEFQTLSINKEKGTVKLKPQLIQYNARYKKYYYHRLKIARAGQHGLIPISRWNVPKPSKELIVDYESRKRIFTDELNKEIQKDFDKLEGTYKEPIKLTDIQQEVVDSLKQGMLPKDIAIKRNNHLSNITSIMTSLKKKGIRIVAERENGNRQALRYIVEGV